MQQPQAPQNPAIPTVPVAHSMNISQGYTLNDLIVDVNGADGYTEDKAALGTVSQDFFLQLTDEVKLADDFRPGLNSFSTGLEVLNFCNLNTAALIRAGLRESTASFLTMLRCMMVKFGFACNNLQRRAVYVDEYNVTPTEVFHRRALDARNAEAASLAQAAGAPIPIPDALPAVIPPLNLGPGSFSVNKATGNFISTYWDNIVSVVAHVFRTRGHHYMESYKELYARTWACTTIEVPNGVQMPTWEEISRAGLHCFGVRALHQVREWSRVHGRLAKGLVIRLDAACAGSAPVRTAAAALKEMSAAGWWTHFDAKYHAHIVAVLAEANRLQAAGTKAHINARLYNWADTWEKADEQHVIPLSPYILGWIDTLDQKDALSKQVCLNKRADGTTAIRAAWAAVLRNYMRDLSSKTSIAQFLAA